MLVEIRVNQLEQRFVVRASEIASVFGMVGVEKEAFSSSCRRVLRVPIAEGDKNAVPCFMQEDARIAAGDKDICHGRALQLADVIPYHVQP